MHTIRSETNAVLQEFGGVIPETICSFEDARREFLYVRESERQKIGIAPSNKTAENALLDVSVRDGELVLSGCDSPAAISPAFVEYQPTNSTDRHKVTIVDAEDIPGFEGQRAIAFYADPMRYRLSFDSWDTGTLYLWYDEVEDLESLEGTDTNGDEVAIKFPLQFWQLLRKRAAFNLIDTICLKLAWHMRPEEKDQTAGIIAALRMKEQKLALRVQELDNEFRRWINRELNQQPFVRRTSMEIGLRGVNDAGIRAFGGFE